MISGLSVDDVRALNALVLEGKRSRSAVRDEAGLEAAVSEMRKEVGGLELYASPYLKAAVLARGLGSIRPFVHANYKTAWLAATVFLGLNQIDLRRMDDLDPMVLIFDLAEGSLSLADAAEWFIERTLEP